MANTSYISKFNFELVNNTKLRMKLSFWILFSVIISFFLYSITSFMIGLFYFLCSSFMIKEFYFAKSMPQQLINGYVGEKNCLKILKKLPDEFTIFNQIEVPSSKSSFNEFETDFIVIGKNSIFIVECKSYIGKIICKNKNNDWQKEEYNQRGKLLRSFIIKSPFKQIYRQRRALLTFMDKLGLDLQVHTLLFLNADKKDIDIPEVPEIPVFTDKKIIKYIKELDKKDYSFKTINDQLNTMNILISINHESIHSRKLRLQNKQFLREYFEEGTSKKTIM